MLLTPAVLEQVFAASVVAVCALLLIRLASGERRRGRIDTGLRRLSARIGRGLDAVFSRPLAERRARREAVAAIRRARARASEPVDGNVYTLKTPRKRRNIH